MTGLAEMMVSNWTTPLDLPAAKHYRVGAMGPLSGPITKDPREWDVQTELPELKQRQLRQAAMPTGMKNVKLMQLDAAKLKEF